MACSTVCICERERGYVLSGTLRKDYSDKKGAGEGREQWPKY